MGCGDILIRADYQNASWLSTGVGANRGEGAMTSADPAPRVSAGRPVRCQLKGLDVEGVGVGERRAAEEVERLLRGLLTDVEIGGTQAGSPWPPSARQVASGRTGARCQPN